MTPLRLIIGGSSCVGKTWLARHLCEQFDIKHIETDRTLPLDPQLHPLDGPPDIWDRPAEELRDLLILAAHFAVPHLLQQIQDLSASTAGWVLEGERVHPKLVERVSMKGKARGVFIVEADAERLYETLVARLPGFKSLPLSRQLRVAELDHRYNLWLREEAACRNLICIESQPWPSLADRVLAAIARTKEC